MIRWLLAALLLAGCGEKSEIPPPASAEDGPAGAAGDEPVPFVCVGVDPGDAAKDAAAGPLESEGREAPLEQGEAAPAWKLADFQPQSCGHEATYGMEAFKGGVTIVALLASW